MKELLDLAQKKNVKAEVIQLSKDRLPVKFENGELQTLSSEKTNDVGVRVISDGHVGFAAASDTDDLEDLLNRAIKVCPHGMEAKFDFPEKAEVEELSSSDDTINLVQPEAIIEEGQRQLDYLKKELGNDITVVSGLSKGSNTLKFSNTSGADYQQKVTAFSQSVYVTLPGSGSGPYAEQTRVGFDKMDDKKLDDLIKRYHWAKKESKPTSGKKQVLFTPDCFYALQWRIETAISAKSYLDDISVLKGGVGEQAIDSRVTLWDKPHYNNHPISRAFDDEGVPTMDRKIFDQGVFTGFLHNLDTASRMDGAEPTGNGYKMGRWQSGMQVAPSPQPMHLAFEPGETDSDDMIASMDDGIIIVSALGAHSGNIPAGQLSISVGIGYHVKAGKVVGRAMDTMLSGNIWEMFNKLGGISKNLSESGIPHIMFDGVEVTS